MSSVEWTKRVVELVKRYGVKFEAEESVRMHIGSAVVEIREADEGFRVTAQIQLPQSESPSQDFDYAAEQFAETMKFVSKLKSGQIVYELDTSLPDYPYFIVSRLYRSLDELLKDLEEALKELT